MSLTTCRDCKRFYPEYCDDGRCGHCHNALVEKKEQAAAARTKHQMPRHCGRCDPRTRQIDLSQDKDGSLMARCSRCHPLSAEPLPQTLWQQKQDRHLHAA